MANVVLVLRTAVPRNGFSQIQSLGNLISVCFSRALSALWCIAWSVFRQFSLSHIVKTHIRLRVHGFTGRNWSEEEYFPQGISEKDVFLMITDARELGA